MNLNISKKEIAVIKPNKKSSELTEYEGNHVQIPNHNIEKLQTKFVPQFNENGFNEVREIYFSEEKQVYLTFDDGPSKDVTPQILDILKEENLISDEDIADKSCEGFSIVYYDDKYADTDGVKASKRMLDSAGVIYRQYVPSGKEINIKL